MTFCKRFIKIMAEGKTVTNTSLTPRMAVTDSSMSKEALPEKRSASEAVKTRASPLTTSLNYPQKCAVIEE